MSRNIVFEGWLTKSPPTKRIWRTKWRRRWFALRQSGELPGQYFLDYYAERNCRRLKGTINLDLCEQVDAGLHMERGGSGSLDPKLRGSVFTIQTQSRTYHLEADCEADMEKWVDAICNVCGLRATEDPSNETDTYQSNIAMTAMNEQYECRNTTEPYIRISECITGIRSQDPRAFTFDPKNIVTSSRRPFKIVPGNRANPMYLSQPNNAEFSENESNLSDDECKSLNASQSNIGPPVPPRPPKTLAISSKSSTQKEFFHGPSYNEPLDTSDNIFQVERSASLSAARRLAQASPPAPARATPAPLPPLTSLAPAPRVGDDEDDQYDHSPGHPSMQYCNVSSLPPAVDRALKPRHPGHAAGHANTPNGQVILQFHKDGVRADALQYLDLDLQTSNPDPPRAHETHRKKMEVTHGKSLSEVDADCAYKTVDFLKTEAFNITRQDAEASRSNQQ